jgi:hypothetical protein
MSKSTKSKAKANESSIADLQTHAATIRAELAVPKQSDVFRCAVEAGYLAALADGEVDDGERATMVRAVEILSEGAVIEWEAEELLDACAERAQAGVKERAEAVGQELLALGQAEAGILFAAIVARATKGVDKQEAEVLKAVGSAAGLTADRVRDIVKKATSLS